MQLTAFFCILIFSLISQEIKGFTFQFCSNINKGTCLDQIYNQDSFIPATINSLYEENPNYKYMFIIQVDSTEAITINLDNINDYLYVVFENQSYPPITIQTSVDANTYRYTFNYPSIIAKGCYLIIENTNLKNDQTVFICNNIEYSKIIEKDITKPLYIIRKGGYSDFQYRFESQLSTVLYLGHSMVYVDLLNEINESKTIILSTSLTNSYDNYYNDDCYVYLTTHIPVKIVFGENKLTIETDNKKTLTIESKTHNTQMYIYLYDSSIITIEEGVNEYDLLSFFINSQESNVKSPICEIQGNWPIIKTTHIEEEYIGNGSILRGKNKYYFLEGSFLFSANNFPVNTLEGTLVLTKNVSSVYYIRTVMRDNVTILTKNEVETIFIIDGLPITTTYGNNYKQYLITESSLLKIFANTIREIAVIGPASLIYKKIDNRKNEVDSILNFLNGGSIILPFGIDYELLFDQFENIYNDYGVTNPRPIKNESKSIWYDYCINFVKDRISDLSDVINNIENKFFPPLTINLINDDSYKINKINTLTINRNDIPFTSLYSNSLNKQATVFCIQNQAINLSEWNVILDNKLIRGFVEEGYENDIFFNKYIPLFSSTSISLSKKLTDDKRCITIQPKSIQKSVFEHFVYTSNETFIEILEKVNVINVLTPSDLDASTKIINKNSKNFLIIVLDDLPEGKSINLDGVGRGSNVILVGFKIDSIDEILECIDKSEHLNSTEFAKYISQFASQYINYQPTVLLTFNSVQTFCVASVKYLGTKIRCTNFWAILSTFPNLEKNPNDFSAQITLTETLTYKHISHLPFTDLVIFPVSLYPPNLLTIDQINFTEKQWSLKMSEFFDEEGYTKEESSFYTINTEKIRGQLFLYSFSYSCTLTIPENKEGQKIKGGSINHFSIIKPKVSNIHGMILLKDKDDEDNSLLNYLADSVQNKIKSKESEVTNGFVFTGNWDKVSSIDGYFEINAGSAPATVESVPTIVAEILDVKSDKSIQISGLSEKMFFSKPQIISQAKTISFKDKNILVNFDNLTFRGNMASLSLLIDGNPSKIVTNHAVIETKTNAIVSSDFEVKESIELGPESSLKANLASTTNVKLTLNYRLGSNFASIHNSIQPNQIILNYVGESDSLDDEIDYSFYSDVEKEIKNFSGNDHAEKCDEWLSKSSFHSDFYPEFRVKGQVVDIVCIDKESTTVLSLKVTAVPEGEVIIPTDDDSDDIFDPTDNEVDDDGNGSGGTNGETPKDKKKMSFFLLCAIIVGGIVLIVIVIVIVVAYKSLSKKKKDNEEQNKDEASLGENTDDNSPPQQKEVQHAEMKNAKLENSSDKDNESDMDFWIYP